MNFPLALSVEPRQMEMSALINIPYNVLPSIFFPNQNSGNQLKDMKNGQQQRQGVQDLYNIQYNDEDEISKLTGPLVGINRGDEDESDNELIRAIEESSQRERRQSRDVDNDNQYMNEQGYEQNRGIRIGNDSDDDDNQDGIQDYGVQDDYNNEEDQGSSINKGSDSLKDTLGKKQDKENIQVTQELEMLRGFREYDIIMERRNKEENKKEKQIQTEHKDVIIDPLIEMEREVMEGMAEWERKKKELNAVRSQDKDKWKWRGRYDVHDAIKQKQKIKKGKGGGIGNGSESGDEKEIKTRFRERKFALNFNEKLPDDLIIREDDINGEEIEGNDDGNLSGQNQRIKKEAKNVIEIDMEEKFNEQQQEDNEDKPPKLFTSRVNFIRLEPKRPTGDKLKSLIRRIEKQQQTQKLQKKTQIRQSKSDDKKQTKEKRKELMRAVDHELEKIKQDEQEIQHMRDIQKWQTERAFALREMANDLISSEFDKTIFVQGQASTAFGLNSSDKWRTNEQIEEQSIQPKDTKNDKFKICTNSQYQAESLFASSPDEIHQIAEQLVLLDTRPEQCRNQPLTADLPAATALILMLENSSSEINETSNQQQIQTPESLSTLNSGFLIKQAIPSLFKNIPSQLVLGSSILGILPNALPRSLLVLLAFLGNGPGLALLPRHVLYELLRTVKDSMSDFKYAYSNSLEQALVETISDGLPVHTPADHFIMKLLLLRQRWLEGKEEKRDKKIDDNRKQNNKKDKLQDLRSNNAKKKGNLNNGGMDKDLNEISETEDDSNDEELENDFDLDEINNLYNSGNNENEYFHKSRFRKLLHHLRMEIEEQRIERAQKAQIKSRMKSKQGNDRDKRDQILGEEWSEFFRNPLIQTAMVGNDLVRMNEDVEQHNYYQSKAGAEFVSFVQTSASQSVADGDFARKIHSDRQAIDNMVDLDEAPERRKRRRLNLVEEEERRLRAEAMEDDWTERGFVGGIDSAAAIEASKNRHPEKEYEEDKRYKSLLYEELGDYNEDSENEEYEDEFGDDQDGRYLHGRKDGRKIGKQGRFLLQFDAPEVIENTAVVTAQPAYETEGSSESISDMNELGLLNGGYGAEDDDEQNYSVSSTYEDNSGAQTPLNVSSQSQSPDLAIGGG
ncbi:MAG: hypothetical protein EZS28_017297, partial [Streblomastix strix]